MGAGVSVDSVTNSAPTGTLSDETKAALAALTPEARAEIETLLALQTATTADGKAIAMKLAPARYDLLKDLFKKIDIDGDGNITRAEYAERVKHPTLAKAFDFMDGEQAGIIPSLVRQALSDLECLTGAGGSRQLPQPTRFQRTERRQVHS